MSLVSLVFASCRTGMPTEREYLVANSEILALSGEGETAMLSRYAEADLYFLGEKHGVAENLQVTLAMLKQLNRDYGLRNFLAELGYSSGWILNRYLKTGDTHLLDIVVGGSRGTYFGTAEIAQFLVDIRQWNLTRPEAERIEYVGIDIDHNPDTVAFHLDDLASRAVGSEPALLADLRSGLSEYAEGLMDRAALFADFAEPAWLEYLAHTEAWSAWCGEDAAMELRLTMLSLYRGLYWYVEQECETDRDAYIREIFRLLHHEGERYLGLWGWYHVPIRTREGRERIAALLLRDGFDVVACRLLYDSGRGYDPRDPENDRAVRDGFFTTNRFISASDGAAVSLFDLAAEDSPFYTNDRLNWSEGGWSSAETCQLCVVIRGATPMTLYE